ncbi:integrase family protein [Methylomarinum sp. Ch1-1]|uniref:Integrase family protein n=1 Tax=Methylomarinum roseum TaxID=3067653 RepID=A0AAU7NXX0_9GAMM|nr:integrase family protein [Methylomarinum sp. Ch1-1]MDP4522520.1 integrase family protein [Methylomarinum sp. Ch1-1]
MASKIKLTKSAVDKLPLPESGQVIYWDTDLSGFGLRVGKQSKAFICERRIDGKTVRTTLGKHPALTAPVARKMAQETLGDMTRGINPTAEKQERKAKAVTLEQVFDEFMAGRSLKPRTVYDYKRAMEVAYGDWYRKSIVDISKDMVERRHKKIGEERGHAYANLSARVLRSVLNFASAKYEDSKGNSILPENPVSRLSKTKQWYRVDRRTGHLKAHELKAWFDAVLAIDNPVIRDYMQFVLLTGCRRQEAARLRWDDVSFEDRSFFIRDPKNKNPIVLPLSDYLADLLKGRKVGNDSPFVFPADSASGHLAEPKKRVIAVGESIGNHFTLHDLRRTFITIAESLDISHYTLKALVNHKMDSSDITSSYLQLNTERLREPMQRITDFVLRSAEIRQSAEVVELDRVRVAK